jgi:hypothetical protein
MLTQARHLTALRLAGLHSGSEEARYVASSRSDDPRFGEHGNESLGALGSLDAGFA